MIEVFIKRAPFKYTKNNNFITTSAYHQYTKRYIIVDLNKSKGVFKYRQYFVYKNTFILLYESDYIDIVLKHNESYESMIDNFIADIMTIGVKDHTNDKEMIPVIKIEDFDPFDYQPEAVH